MRTRALGSVMRSSAERAACVQALHKRGYCVLPGQYPEAQVAQLRSAVVEQYESLGRPGLYSKKPKNVGEDVEISATGLVLSKLLKRCPDLTSAMLDEEVVRIVQSALGLEVRLELTAAVIADDTRPFFPWHNHAGGIDQELYRRRGERPRPPDLKRIAMIVYLDVQNAGAGRLLVHPERHADGSPPHADAGAPWPGQVVVEGPPGTVVLLDQTTWHAALRRTRGGLRVFFGLWFASADAGATELQDESLRRARGASLLWDELVE